MHGGEKCIQILDRKPGGRKPLERTRCRWEDIIRIDLMRNRVGSCVLDLSESK
jgi:hypothetical protein